MSLPVVPPIQPVAQIETAAKAELVAVETWLQKHERILITVLVLGASLFIGDKFLNLSAARDERAATAAAATLTAQQTTNNQLAAQIAQTVADYKTLVVQLTQQNAQLTANQSQRTIVLQQQVKTDATLPLPDLGNRWAGLANIGTSDITATTAGITVTPQGALSTVTQLEQVPVLQQNLADQKTETANLNTELGASNALTGQLQTQVTNLNTTIVDKDKSCKADITAAKAEARKGKLKAFAYGFVAGVVSTVVLIFH